MELKSTNYYNTFIEIAGDCLVNEAEIPDMSRDKMSVTASEFKLISENPYGYTMDDIAFGVYALRNNLNMNDMALRAEFFSKGRPCLRSSALGKRYGRGIHCNSDGKLALCAVGSERYNLLLADTSVKKIRAMRNKRIS